MCFVYMIKNSSGKLYVGISQDPKKRLRNHNQRQGAEFTKYKPDFQLVFLESQPTLTDARRREIQIKKWRRDKKDFLISQYSKALLK